MDDSKLSHKNPEMISYIINELKKIFGELYVVRGNKHTFLGMNIEVKYSKIQVDMEKKLDECIEMFREDVSTFVTSPARK